MDRQISQKLKLYFRSYFLRVQLTKLMLNFLTNHFLIPFRPFCLRNIVLTHNLFLSLGPIPMGPSVRPSKYSTFGVDNVAKSVFSQLHKLIPSTILRVGQNQWHFRHIGLSILPLALAWILRRKKLGVEGIYLHQQIPLAGKISQIGCLGRQAALLCMDVRFASILLFSQAAGESSRWVVRWGEYLSVGTG